MENQNNHPNSQAVEPKEITWQALEYPEYKKHPLWFMGLAVIIALIVVYGIYTNSWTTIIAFSLFGAMAFIYAGRKPRTITVKLDARGVHMNQLQYNYAIIRKFWIIYSPPEVKVLYIETNAYLDHQVRIELGNQDPRVVKSFLKQYLEEDLDGEENILDVMARKIKF